MEDLTWRPTRITEIIARVKPDTLGDQDASALGMGGVHFVPQEDGQVLPLLWWSPFPCAIQECLVSFDDPAGEINNIELELSVSVVHHGILAQKCDSWESTIHNSSDNVATVWWQRKGATLSSGPTAGLLRLQTIYQRRYCYVPMIGYIADEANAMADARS